MEGLFDFKGRAKRSDWQFESLSIWLEAILESFEKRPLVTPIARQTVLLAPIGREASWLLALQCIANNVWREKRQINHLLDAAF